MTPRSRLGRHGPGHGYLQRSCRPRCNPTHPFVNSATLRRPFRSRDRARMRACDRPGDGVVSITLTLRPGEHGIRDRQALTICQIRRTNAGAAGGRYTTRGRCNPAALVASPGKISSPRVPCRQLIRLVQLCQMISPTTHHRHRSWRRRRRMFCTIRNPSLYKHACAKAPSRCPLVISQPLPSRPYCDTSVSGPSSSPGSAADRNA